MSEKREIDDFWDIDKLIPEKYRSTSTKGQINAPSRFSPERVTADVNIDGNKDHNDTADERKLSFTEPSNSYEEEIYVPEGSTLIKTVKIRNYRDRYDFYDSFRKAALVYYDYSVPKCDYVSFYSYMPQYSQLNKEQKNYYFFWRNEMRKGRFIKTDYSYLYLYVYEILNLPDKIPPREGLSRLCDVWARYRDELPRIDSAFVIWVQDYCLVHNLPCPFDKIGGFIYDVINASTFKEFYLADFSCLNEGAVSAMLAYLSDYDWRKGKYSSGENKDMYKRHMEGAMKRILMRAFDNRSFVSFSENTERISRAAFPNSLCTHSVKRNLEIEYYPISHSYAIRRTVTEAVRYTENKLRSMFGIKSRLTVKGLEDEYKRLIDTYFDRIFDDERKKARLASRPEYEKLYEAPRVAISLEGADEIESASWSVTARLVDGTDDVETSNNVSVYSAVTVAVEQKPDLTETDLTEYTDGDGDVSYGLNEEEIELIAKALDGCLKQELGIDSKIERINEAFSDNTGDVIFESDGDSYTIIEDYREDIEEWLKKIRH